MKKIHLFQIILLVAIVLVNADCQKEISCTNCTDANKPPTAMAGVDQVITLPVNSVSLDGRGSTDPDGTITGWSWSKISGPSSFIIAASTASQTTATNLVGGTYQFELVVTDNGGLSDKDTIQVIVNPVVSTNQPPVANAGPDKIINLPVNSVNLDGSSSSDPNNNIITYQWTKIAGPSSFTIASPAAVQTTVTNLAEGIYMFELKVTDAGGLSDTDTSMVEVKQVSQPVDVYVAGGGDGASKYWKNGQEVFLHPDLSVNDFANSIAVVGNDVYVAGEDGDVMASSNWPRYWKNGQEVRLTNGTTEAGTTSIAVSGNDVYVAGWEIIGSITLAVYWKNGQKVVLTNSMNSGAASSIAIVGNDVYVSGYESNASGFHVAKYWKNGQAVLLTNEMYRSVASSITIVGSDVYVSGYVYNGSKYVACYWKNGQKVVLTNGMNNVFALSIAVFGSDVYVAGFSMGSGFNVAKYWKNGQEFLLPNGSIANSIAVFDSDVYITGNSNVSNNDAKYWKNGQEVMLPNGSHTTSIVVVRR